MKPKILTKLPERVPQARCALWNMDTSALLEWLPKRPLWDLVVTSPPYNIGKAYESKLTLEDYVAWQTEVIEGLVARLSSTGSICWQVGNYIENGHIEPLDYVFHPIFTGMGLKLRNRIVWRYGHGMHQQRRFSGRYEIVLWYTKADDYVFDLDAVRVPPKYPGKRAYKGPRVGKLSSHPLGKNPEDVWEVPEADTDIWNIPNVKAAHLEKTGHPCQFPVGLVERLVLALTRPDDRVFDPFSGVGSAGVAAALHNRRFWGCEIDPQFNKVAADRIRDAANGEYRFRSHARPLYDHTTSPLSRVDRERPNGERAVRMNGTAKPAGAAR